MFLKMQHTNNKAISSQVQPRKPGDAGALRGNASERKRLRPGGKPRRAQVVSCRSGAGILSPETVKKSMDNVI